MDAPPEDLLAATTEERLRRGGRERPEAALVGAACARTPAARLEHLP